MNHNIHNYNNIKNFYNLSSAFLPRRGWVDDFCRGKTAVEDRRPVKAKAKGRRKICLAAKLRGSRAFHSPHGLQNSRRRFNP